ncbi:MAG: carbon-nitrogen hydrolase family protein [Lentisphaerae bacterium]|jgi:predicted amidohydrolase|nr:carbon-nitrogen hydrolase family protein [Lentisphaerota bacterium]
MKRTLHVGAALIDSSGTPQENLERIAQQARIAEAIGVEVLLFAEVALHGYDYEVTSEQVAALAETVEGESCQRLVAIAAVHNVTLMVGMFERADGVFYNSHVVVGPQGILGVQRKHCMAPVDEEAGIVRGPYERTVFTFKGVRTAILICADTGIKDRYGLMARQGIDYTFIPTGGGGRVEDYICEADLASDEGMARHVANLPRVFLSKPFDEQSRKHRLGFTATNAMGRAGVNTCHQGHATIVDNNGIIRAQAPGTIIRDHQHDTLIHARLNFN